MHRSRPIGKQSGESLESVLKKKREATVGRICRKGRFYAWNERVRGDGILIIISVSSITTIYSIVKCFAQRASLCRPKWSRVKAMYRPCTARRYWPSLGDVHVLYVDESLNRETL